MEPGGAGRQIGAGALDKGGGTVERAKRSPRSYGERRGQDLYGRKQVVCALYREFVSALCHGERKARALRLLRVLCLPGVESAARVGGLSGLNGSDEAECESEDK